jgi:hypothetical protein
MIASRPATPVVAAATGIVPLYEVPVIPTMPVDQAVALTSSAPSIEVNPFARPFSQSITAFGANSSGVLPTVGHPLGETVLDRWCLKKIRHPETQLYSRRTI